MDLLLFKCIVIYSNIKDYVKNKYQCNVENVKCGIVIRYHYKGRDYAIPIRRKRKVSKYRKYYTTQHDGSKIDITNYILKIRGPYNNYHGLHITPHDLGFDNLLIECIDGQLISVSKDNKLC